MKRTRRLSMRISIAILGMLVAMWSALPASAQSGQSNTADQPAASRLPDAPEPQSSETSQSVTQAPSGAAGAKAAPVHGAPVAQPVGAAVAPPRQHGHRSLLIKVGLLAGAGVAIGSVVALSERSPARPPTSAASTR